MHVENACRASRIGEITPENLSPVPKNPMIAAFFNQIGNADELGSGTRNLYKYSKRYSGQNPSIIEGDIFRIIVPLDDTYSFDAAKVGDRVGDKVGDIGFYYLTENQRRIMDCLAEKPEMSAAQLAKVIGISSRKIENNIRKLKDLGILQRKGTPRKGYWVVKREG